VASLRRGIDSRFKDEDLTRVLQDATESIAGAPGARGISSCFRIAEILIIERARQWGVCSFNDFRKFLGLKGDFFLFPPSLQYLLNNDLQL
jgi:hypothetical protein